MDVLAGELPMETASDQLQAVIETVIARGVKAHGSRRILRDRPL
jgi:hypothetical protein